MSVERLTDDYLATVPSSNSGCILATHTARFASRSTALCSALFALNRVQSKIDCDHVVSSFESFLLDFTVG
jgi:hypothetical protein